MSLIPYPSEYEDYVRLARRLRHDGTRVAPGDVRPGDFVYVSDGPRIITAVRSIPQGITVGIDDTGGPITGGWVSGRPVYRGGRDHFLAIADSAESNLRRWQRRTGRKHP